MLKLVAIYRKRRNLYSKLPIIIFLLFFPSIFFGLFTGKIVISSLLCFGLIAYIVALNYRGLNYDDFRARTAIYLLFAYNIITFGRGLFNVTDRSDWATLISSDVFVYFLFPFFIFFADFDIFKRICRLLCTIGLACCAIGYFIPALDEPMSFGHNMFFVNLFILCLPYLKDRKYYLYFVLLAFLAISYNLDRRSVTINYVVTFGIIIFYKFIKGFQWRRFFFIVTAISPLILLGLGLTGVFNVFRYVETFDVAIELKSERRYNVDSRTGIYVDVFGELNRQHKMLFGLGNRGRTKTSLADNPNIGYWEMYRRGRTQTESGMLNFFQYGGLMGFMVYSYLFLSCAFYALFRSKNDFIKAIGYFTLFKYLYSFIEDPLVTNVSTFCLFLLFGLCLNKKMSQLSNKEIVAYLNTIFRKHTLIKISD